MLGGVFISYRRDDSSGFARGIYDRLAKRLGRKSVFFDVDNIELGEDFVDVLSERVGKCNALVAVIGASWCSSADTRNQRRLDHPHDFVRIEIEAALERNIRVIPVLVDGASMPRPEDLPDSLKKLARRQGIEVSHTHFDSDVKKLTRTLSLMLEELRQSEEAAALRLAELESARQAEAQRQAEDTAETERLVREERERLADQERREKEAAEAERAAREKREAASAEMANRRAALADTASRAEEERRARDKAQAETQLAEDAAEAERVAREERERQQAAAASLAEELRARREAAEAERQKQERQKAADAARAEEERRLAEAEAARRAEDERRAKEAADVERAEREEREQRQAGEAARVEEGHRLAEVTRRSEDERRAKEDAEAKGIVRDERERQESTKATQRAEGERRAGKAAEAEQPARAERERQDATAAGSADHLGREANGSIATNSMFTALGRSLPLSWEEPLSASLFVRITVGVELIVLCLFILVCFQELIVLEIIIQASTLSVYAVIPCAIWISARRKRANPSGHISYLLSSVYSVLLATLFGSACIPGFLYFHTGGLGSSPLSSLDEMNLFLLSQGLIWPALIIILFGGLVWYYLIFMVFEKTISYLRLSVANVGLIGIIPLIWYSAGMLLPGAFHQQYYIYNSIFSAFSMLFYVIFHILGTVAAGSAIGFWIQYSIIRSSKESNAND